MRLRSFADDFFPDPPRAEYLQPRRRAVRCWSSSAAQRTGNPGGMASVRNSPVISCSSAHGQTRRSRRMAPHVRKRPERRRGVPGNKIAGCRRATRPRPCGRSSARPGGTRPRRQQGIRRAAGRTCSRWSGRADVPRRRRDRCGHTAAAGVLRAEPGRPGYRRRGSVCRLRRVGTGRPRHPVRARDVARPAARQSVCRPTRKAARAASRACRNFSARRGWAKAEPLTLSTLWDSLPENRLAPLDDAGTSRRTPLYVDHQVVDPDPHPLVSVPVAYFPPG